MSMATLLPEGKIELPEEIHHVLHLQVGNQLSFTVVQNQVVIQAIWILVQSFKGMLKRPNTKVVSMQ